jgi:outer membrane protein OmpA-like peptidoglycan-associated protein
MKNKAVYWQLAIFSTALAACSTPPKDTAALKAAIEAGYQGHYAQSVRHEEMAEEDQEVADRVLKHWQDDQYWNIDEKQKAMDATQSAAQHRKESEKEMCLWLMGLHDDKAHETHHEYHQHEMMQHSAAFFPTGSAVPNKTDHEAIHHIGHFLKEHPEAKAFVTASTDTVGNAASNQALSEKRAEAVKHLLIAQGAKAAQIEAKATGKAAGPDHVASQQNRTAVITVNQPPHHHEHGEHHHHMDCANLK